MTVIPELERDLVHAAGRLRGRRLRLRLKSLAAAAVTAVVLVGVVALDRDGGSERDAGQPAAPGLNRREGGRPVDPRTVTVAVLNGTLTPGLAATISDELDAHGFKLGYISNAPGRRPRRESVILFAPGHRREAIAVGRLLGIQALKRVAPHSHTLADPNALANPAHVTVIAGSDQRPHQSTTP